MASSFPLRGRARLTAVVMVVGLAIGSLASAHAAGAHAAGASAQPRVAVLDFQGTGATKDTESLGVGLQSMLTTDLAQVSSIALVERARLREVQKELKLSRSALADPGTAARLGKLAGASHLITGSHTELNKKMRLDARLVEVATGKVVLASSAEGDIDAFFELEKTLVGKLIEAIGVKLSAKERGAVARIHTTDLEAFRQFSAGVQLFDQEKYDESLVALRSALKKDDDFKLARTTLDTYERLAAELRARATDIDAIEKTSAREKNQGRQAEQRKVMDRLFELARATGGDRFRRAAATYMLACEHSRQVHGASLYGLEDSFAEQRTVDALAQRFYPDALALFPRLPLVVHCFTNIGGPAPESLTKFEAEFDEIAKRLDMTGENVKHTLRTSWLAANLHLDHRGEADLTDKVYGLMTKLKVVDDEWRLDMLEGRAALRASLFEFDEAVRLLKQAADIAENATHSGNTKADRLRKYAERIEEVSVMSEVIKRLDNKPLLREYASLTMMDSSFNTGARRWPRDLKGIAKDLERSDILTRLPYYRRIRTDDGVLVSGTPVWLTRGGTVVTGARTAGIRTDEVRYYADRFPLDTVLIFEGVPRKDLKASFELGFGLPSDVVPPDGLRDRETLNTAHAGVTFLFGAKCISCSHTPDPTTGHWKSDEQPLEAWGLDFGPSEVRLVQVSLRKEGGGRNAPPPLVLTVKGTQAAALTGTELPVAIQLQGTQLTATIQGKTYTFSVPAERPAGFYGVLVRGPGFAAIRKVQSGAR